MKKQCHLPIGPRQPPTTMNFKEKGKPPDLARDAQKGIIGYMNASQNMTKTGNLLLQKKDCQSGN